ncbi:transposase family protein [Paraburkholderia sp. 22B1P]|uniref:transposase family protein n=1 Tax=Paraburkholderia sp. 22B1P TaxID=3080498 RepID=UPI00308AE684|nr:transposase family protein [Paraburkholderia sp. 22B1P]
MAMVIKATSVVAAGQLFQDTQTNEVFRIVFTGNGQADTFLCAILGEKLVIRQHATEEFNRLAEPGSADGRYVKIDDDPFARSKQVHKEGIHQVKSAQNWRTIASLVTGNDDSGRPKILGLLKRQTRRMYLLEYATHHKYGVPLLYKLLRRYLQRGMNASAVVSGYPNCGASRSNVVFVSKVGSKGLIKSEPVVRNYRQRPGRAPGDRNYTYALPGTILERLFWQHVDIYTTWEQCPWHALPEAKKLGKQLRGGKTKRHDNGVVRVSKRRAVRGLLPRPRDRRAKGQRSKPSQADLVDSVNYQLRKELEVWNDGRIVKLTLSSDQVVTDRQFQHFWLKTQPNFVRRRTRHPDEEDVRRPMPARGRARQHIKGPGQSFLIDSTVLDLYVVSPLDRKLVLGRPTLYFVVDLYSGMIVGFYLGLEHPSHEAAALALVNMVTPKKGFCAQFGFNISEDDWPTHYLPSEFAADRGSELKSIDPWRALIQEYGVGISNAPPGEPTWRGVGERRFGSVNRVYQRATFGVVERDFGTRFARRYPWDARYTCAELTTMLLRAIHSYHRNPTAGGQPPPPEMLWAGKADTPLERWNWGIKHGSGVLREANPEELKRVVWPPGRARMYPTGVLWKRVWYRCEPLEDEFWRMTGGKGKDRSSSVDIQFEPSDMAEIRVKAFGYEVTCSFDVNRNEHDLRGVSLAEWEDMKAQAGINRRAKRLAEQAQRIMQLRNTQLDDEEARLIQKAQLKEAGVTHPDARDIKENRRRHRELEAKAKARAAAKKAAQHPQQAVKETVKAVDQAMEKAEVSTVAQTAADRLRSAMYG